MSATDTTTRPEVRREAATQVSGWRRRVPGEATTLFWLSSIAYVSLSAYLLLVRHAISVDGISRVANAQYVVSSRDPHLAAIGFVWNPLPSMLEVPFIPLRHVFPTLISSSLIGGVESSLFMAGAAVLVRGILFDLGVGLVGRILLTLAFVLHPMIAIYAYNGMSEAPLLFFSLLTARWLIRWLRDGSSITLTLAGLALALGYLTRYEMVAPALAVVTVVAVLGAWRTSGSWRERRTSGLCDAALVGLPFAFAFAMWAVFSRVIVGQWFPTFQSQYGNSAQVASGRSFIDKVIGSTTLDRLHYVGQQLAGLEPLVLILVPLVLVASLLRRDVRVLGPVATAGAVIAFDVAATVTGHSFGWLRFSIAVIPLSILLAGCLIALAGRRPVLRAAATLTAAALVLPALWTSRNTLIDPKLAREEVTALSAVISPATATRDSLEQYQRWSLGPIMAADIDALHPGRGSVLTDAANAFPMLVASAHTSTFVITPDQDFQQVLADPLRFSARYVLVPDPGHVSTDALNVAYPDLYEHGWPGGTLVREWAGLGGSPTWRLYRLPARASAF